MLKVQEIREIVEMIENSSIQRFEFSQADTRLVIVKQGAAETTVMPAQMEESLIRALPSAQKEATKAATQSAAPDDELHKIISPMVGTFYAAPDPESPAFVKTGQSITADQVVCIIEVMKLFNEVQAGVNGEIVEVLVKDGEFVEYGQPLFLVKKG